MWRVTILLVCLVVFGCSRGINDAEATDVAKQFLRAKVEDSQLLDYSATRTQYGWDVTVNPTPAWSEKHKDPKEHHFPLTVEVSQQGAVTSYM